MMTRYGLHTEAELAGVVEGGVVEVSCYAVMTGIFLRFE